MILYMAERRNVTFLDSIYLFLEGVYQNILNREAEILILSKDSHFGRCRKYIFSFIIRDDYMKISNDKGQTFGLFCRDKTGKAVLVTGASATIKFRSDFFLEKKGFQLIFTSVPIGRKYESR